MPTELEELVEFLHHGNTQIRQVATENLVGYSTSQPSIFKSDQLRPIRDLKLLVRDYPPIAKNALTILINVSTDPETLSLLASPEKDTPHDKADAFLESLLQRITTKAEPSSNLISMLLANLAKSPSMKRILTLRRPPVPDLSTAEIAMDQLMDLFVKGAEGSWNKDADFDYLAYFFADMAKWEEGRRYFLTERAYDGVVPISKLVVFTERGSEVRRKGVASTIKNVSFDIDAHPRLIERDNIDLLPYILLPITGPEELSEEETLSLPEPLQLLPPDKKRDASHDIIITHLETLMLLTTTKPVRETMREVGVYPVIRELHLAVEHEEVRDHVERLVGVLQRDEEGEGDGEGAAVTAMPEKKGGSGDVEPTAAKAKELEEDEDDQMVEII